jgi:hypothetical protein
LFLSYIELKIAESWVINDRSKLFYDLLVGSAFGFDHFEVGVGCADDPADSEEEETWKCVISRHYSFDNWWYRSHDPSCNPSDDVENNDLLGRDYFGDIGPGDGEEGATIDQHE